jgi:hypothetical protein
MSAFDAKDVAARQAAERAFDDARNGAQMHPHAKDRALLRSLRAENERLVKERDEALSLAHFDDVSIAKERDAALAAAKYASEESQRLERLAADMQAEAREAQAAVQALTDSGLAEIAALTAEVARLRKVADAAREAEEALRIGDRVAVSHDRDLDREYSKEAWPLRAKYDGKIGTLFLHSDAHGACWVIDFDGERVGYEPSEVRRALDEMKTSDDIGDERRERLLKLVRKVERLERVETAAREAMKWIGAVEFDHVRDICETRDALRKALEEVDRG